MNRIAWLPGILALVLGSVPSPAHAESGRLGLHAARLDESAAGVDTYVGGHLELRLGGFLGVAGAVDYRTETAGPVGSRVEVRDVPVTVSGRIHLPRFLGMELFGTAGGGWYHRIAEVSTSESSTRDTATRFGWHVGGGLDLLVAPGLSITAEHRRVILSDSGFPPLRGLDVDDPDGTYASLGLSIHF